MHGDIAKFQVISPPSPLNSSGGTLRLGTTTTCQTSEEEKCEDNNANHEKNNEDDQA